MDGGIQSVYGGTVVQTTISNGALQYLHGSASVTTINDGGQQNVYADGAASGTTINAGGVQVDWGTANGTTINGGTQYVWGSATNTSLNYGVQYVGSGGLATDTTIGTGAVEIVFAGGTASGVTFGAGYAGLVLEQSSALTGSISGWQANDFIDLVGIQFDTAGTTLAYAANGDNTAGALTVSDGTHVATLHLLGQYSAADFAIASDGHGGTLITDPAVVAPAQLAALHG
jgi:autotransporter passenger strand-loop-strand repeat protein